MLLTFLTLSIPVKSDVQFSMTSLNDNGSNFIFLSKTQLAVDPARRQQLEKVAYLNDNSWTHTKFIKSLFRWPSGKNGGRAVMSAVVRLVHVWFPLITYMKDILSRSTKTNSNRVIEIFS